MFYGNAAVVIGKHVGNYVVERTLAHGNMGSVFVARHPTLGRQVAVKFLGKDEDLPPPELTARFLDEARITATLRHRNIIDIFDFGELEGRPYYVMELLDGLDLAQVMRVRGQFTTAEVIECLEQICSGLAAAHAAGVVHRDLKPGNIFMLQERPVRFKLMDFGVAKVLHTGSDQTQHGQIIGTPRYMSPEQALGQIDRTSIQSDIYSLGVIAYEMLTGRGPFENASPVVLLVMHVNSPVPPVQELAPDVPTWLAELVQACLAKDPRDRPTSVQHILDTLRARWVAHSVPPEGMFNLASLELPAAQPVLDQSTLSNAEPPELANPVTVDVPVTTFTVADSRHATLEADAGEDNPMPVLAEVLPNAEQPPESHEMQSSAPNESPPQDHADSAHAKLTDADRNTLSRLLSRMQRNGDFPAFVQNVGEVSRRADCEGTCSAEQLGTTILKDYALTAKLLRIVNSAYVNRFGGKIYSVRHAIVILGFDRVRSLALSTSVFKNKGKPEHAERISESAINSLVSGEIARHLCSAAGLDDPEQATVGSMFRHLGRHLTLVYLPELYDQIEQLMREHDMSMNHAAERVLGLSLHKLGVGIAERWRLPAKVISAMCVVPDRSLKLRREEDKLAALADLSNNICDIVASNRSPDERASALAALLARHTNLVQLDDDELKELMLAVQKSFEQRYMSLLGTAARSNRFARSVAAMMGDADPNTAAEKGTKIAPLDPASADAAAAVTNPATSDAQDPATSGGLSPGASQSLPSRGAAAPAATAVHSALDVIVAQTLAEHRRSGNQEQAFMTLLTALSHHLDGVRVLVLRATQSRKELMVVGGIGDDIEGLSRELRLPLAGARSAADPFSACYHSQRDASFDDVFSPRVVSLLPQVYFETIGSASLAVTAGDAKGCQPVVITFDADPPLAVPSVQQLASLTNIRAALTKLAPAATL